MTLYIDLDGFVIGWAPNVKYVLNMLSTDHKIVLFTTSDKTMLRQIERWLHLNLLSNYDRLVSIDPCEKLSCDCLVTNNPELIHTNRYTVPRIFVQFFPETKYLNAGTEIYTVVDLLSFFKREDNT
jgi:hypothetical protein